MTQTVLRKPRKFTIMAVMLAILMVCGAVCNIPALSLSASAGESVQVPPAYQVDGWSQYGGASITASPDGMVMSNASTTGYSYSNTTKQSYALRELSVSFRMEDIVYSSEAQILPYIGIMSEDADFMNTVGAFGLAFTSVDAKTYNVWFGKSNPDATAVPGLDHIKHVTFTLGDSGVVTILFHRESADRWMIMINGNYYIDLEGQTELNQALDALTDVHVAFAAKDCVATNATQQTMKTEVFRVGTDMLGTTEDNYLIDNWATSATYERTEAGIVYNASVTTTDVGSTYLKSVVRDQHTTTLDGLTLSFKKNIVNSVLEVGIGTNHGERCTFWDSWGDRPGVVGSLGIRFSAFDNNVTIFLLPRQDSGSYATVDGLICGGDMSVNEYGIDGDVNIQFLKDKGDWMLLINGRKMGSSDGNFQTALNDTLNSLEAAVSDALIMPWMSAWAEASLSAQAEVTLTGWGNQRLGKESANQEPPVLEMGDEITGTLEFNREDWLNITPSPNVIDVKIDNEQGFVLKGRSVEHGWNVGMAYQKDIGDLKDYAVTVRVPETVLKSEGATHAHYGMFIGDRGNCNFSDMRSIYIRWQYGSEDPTDGAIVEVIVWDNTSGGWKAQTAPVFVSAKTQEGRETEMTIRFVYDEGDGMYRIYANGVCISNVDAETAIAALIPNMDAKYVTVMAAYGTDGVGSAWSADATDMQEITIVSLGGKKPVNEAPEPLASAFAVDGTADSQTQITLSWTKAEYPNGDMDSYSFIPVGYKIERIKGDALEAEKVIMVEGDADTLTYTDTGLDANTFYYYTVYAVDANGNVLMVSNQNKRVQTLGESVDTNPVETNPVESNPVESNPIETDPETSVGSDDVTSPDTTVATETEGKDDDEGCASTVGVSLAGMALVMLAGAAFVFRKERN